MKFEKAIQKVNKYHPIIILILLDLILLCFTFEDYGIGWDENSSRDIGVHNAMVANQQLGYIFFEKEALENRINSSLDSTKRESYLEQKHIDNYQYKMYGPAFELFMVGTEKILNIQNDRQLYLLRHVLTHLFFLLGLFFFYLLLHYHFKDWRISLIGTLMLILVPRLYPHSFFNPKDIPFLVSCILATYTMVRFVDRPDLKKAFWHGLTCALAIDIRIIGIVFPALTIGFLFIEIIQKPKQRREFLLNSGVWIISLIAFTLIFWPYLWKNPLEHFIWSLKSMSAYPWQGSLLFREAIYTPVDYLPASYFPVWFLIMTPPVFFIGFAGSIPNIRNYNLRSFTSFRRTERLHLISLFLFLLPGTAAILLQSVLYDDCRHFFFIYPFFIISSLIGFLWLKEKVKPYLKFKPIISALVITLILLPPFVQMIRLHPYQYVYFNKFAGKDIENNYEIDYWGISYKEGLDYILENSSKQPARIMMGDSILSPVVYNSFLLTEQELGKIEWVEDMKDADYFLTTYRGVITRKSHLDYWNLSPNSEVFSVETEDLKLLSVFKLQNE